MWPVALQQQVRAVPAGAQLLWVLKDQSGTCCSRSLYIYRSMEIVGQWWLALTFTTHMSIHVTTHEAYSPSDLIYSPYMSLAQGMKSDKTNPQPKAVGYTTTLSRLMCSPGWGGTPTLTSFVDRYVRSVDLQELDTKMQKSRSH